MKCLLLRVAMSLNNFAAKATCSDTDAVFSLISTVGKSSGSSAGEASGTPPPIPKTGVGESPLVSVASESLEVPLD